MTTCVEQTLVIVVGAGPSGLSTATSLYKRSIPYIILEREDCIASLWNKKAYDRLRLHLPKVYCELPHMPFPASYPKYVPNKDFLKYMDDYASHFNINPKFNNLVQSAKYDKDSNKWKVEAKVNDGFRCYEGRFLVVATGETSDVFVPDVDGLSEFKGEVIHSTQYKCGKGYENKNVLVVGAGNSGMEIALDLCNYGAKTSIVVRSSIHILSRWSPQLGSMLLKFLPLHLVDTIIVFICGIIYGDLTKYGIRRPKEGPFLLKRRDGKLPVIDVGTSKKIRSHDIQVLPALRSIRDGNEVVFENEKRYPFDTIVFATGFKTTTHLWLQGYGCLLRENGLAKQGFPNHWKGENGLYCAGLARNGLFGASIDAKNIADHIFNQI